MAKRFLETKIIEKEWFMELDNKYKALWFYILCKCDAVGVYERNARFEKIIISDSIDWDFFIANSSDNIEVLPDRKILIVNYCDIQYGDSIKDPDTSSKPLISFHKLLKKHGLYDRFVTGKIESIKSMRNRLTDAKKEEIKARDEFTCQYCYIQLPGNELQIDHFIPLPHGNNEDNNLITSCKSCNSKKYNYMPEELIENDIFTSETLHRVCKYLHSLYKISYTLKEKEKEKVNLKEEEEEKEVIDYFTKIKQKWA